LIIKIITGIAIKRQVMPLGPGMNGKMGGSNDNDAGHAQVMGHLAFPDERPLHDVHADEPGDIL